MSDHLNNHVVPIASRPIAHPHYPVEPFQDQPTHLYTPENPIEALCGFVLGIVPGGNPSLCEHCADRAERKGYVIVEPETPVRVVRNAHPPRRSAGALDRQRTWESRARRIVWFASGHLTRERF